MSLRRALVISIALFGLTVVAPRAQAPAAPPTVVQIAADLHVLALLSDGTVSALGNNRSGQLGRPKVTRGFLPVARVELPERAVQIAAGEDASYAVLEDGTVWAWGRGYARNFGVALEGTERHTPMAVAGLRNVTRIAVDGETVMAILDDGTVLGWGELPAIVTGGQSVVPGVTLPRAIEGLHDVVDLAGGSASGFALTRDGRVFGWGNNRKGQLGRGTESATPLPPGEVTGLRDVVSIAYVAGVAAAVTRDGRVWTWGDNGQAGLGNGLHGDTGDPGQPSPQPVKGIADAVEVKAGTFGRHFIVRRQHQTLIGWGNSDWGQLGAGVSGDHQPTPAAIKLPGVENFWLGGNFSFARTTDGAVWFWGEESASPGLLGLRGNQRLPVKVPLTKFVP